MRVHIRNALSYQEGKGRGLKKNSKSEPCMRRLMRAYLSEARGKIRGDMGWGRDLGT